MTDTPAPEEEVILEPGDPGYQPPEGAEPVPPEEGGPIVAEAAPPGQDLQHVRGPKESEAEFLARTRGVAVESTSPTDIVPNQPQITMGNQNPEPEPEPEPEPASPDSGEKEPTA
jgi:hypothetical protein